jgi:hypothetical protein
MSVAKGGGVRSIDPPEPFQVPSGGGFQSSSGPSHERCRERGCNMC